MINICLTPKPSWGFFVYLIQSKIFFFFRKRAFKGKAGVVDWTKTNPPQKKRFLTAPAVVIKKDPTSSIKKHANELKDHGETMKTAIKQNLSPDLNPFISLYGAF